MERSPRSAGVRPRTGASMGQYHTLRSFVISLAIAILISKSPANGFTVDRDSLNSAPDLETGESKQLEVRYDLKTLNDNKTIYNNKTMADSNSTVIAINNTNNYSDEKGDEQQRIVTHTDDTQTTVSGNNETPTDGTMIITTKTDNTAFTTTAPSTSEYLSTLFSADTTFATDPEIEYPVSNKVTAEENQENTTITPEHQNYTGNITSITTPDMSTASNYVNTNSVFKSEDNMNTVTIIADFESKLTTKINISDQKAEKTNNKEASTTATTDGSLDAHTTVSSESAVILESDSTEVTTQTLNDELFTIDLYPTLPSWKKYTTIDRKRTSTEDTTTIDNDMTRAETAQTRISLEKAFNNTPVSSLEKLRNDLINSQGSTTKQLEITTEIVLKSVSNGSDFEINTSTTKMSTEIETEPTKVELVSRRAGYKDNRETTSAKPSESTATDFSSTVAMNMHENKVEVAKNKTGSVIGSQSQLAEDAIEEELLREETLNDNEENAKLKHWKQARPTDSVSEPVPEDLLSVKPIGMEKKKNTILYAVNPNYKPLKKIDIQPPKLFVRDPDDNSWRNESISSLGIVFKPKNASKSFTEVLKNKTEIELGNMTDKDSKDDLPDLRVRLEKIAEVRKSKKKINKFGDTVYSDYEESSENTNLSRENMPTPMSDVESMFNFTPPPPSQSTSPHTTAFDLAVNSISKEQFELFETEKTSPITTNKPRKVYNLAEYYDTTDEYDADYVNQHKIDLKKFTKAFKPKKSTTQPPEWLRTQPMTEFQPERKATLQYFPPTTKVVQKVNINDYDANFNRKVNLYDINKSKGILDVSFGTVSPRPTEKYEPLKYQETTKPAYTPVYRTDNLDKNLYLADQPSVSEPPPGGHVLNDGNFNRASYLIKHYRDFINEAAKGGEDDRSEEYPYTEPPVRGVTVNDLAKMTPRDSAQGEEDYEYDVKVRKDIMNRFVDNFNQNSERFKVDFPILYNSSVVHRETPEQGRVASSSAFMKRLYEVDRPRPTNFQRRPCDPHCYKTVELSPAYELHYYVPDEEEKEEIEPRSNAPPPYRYRL